MHRFTFRFGMCALMALAATPVFAQDVPTPHVSGSVLTSGASLALGQRIPVQNFKTEDFVVSIVDVQWTPSTLQAGKHFIEHRWLRDGTVVSDGKSVRWFTRTPVELTSRRAAAALGVGHYTVQTLMDGQIVASADLDITG
jgi:hypothetical protein